MGITQQCSDLGPSQGLRPLYVRHLYLPGY